LQTLASWRREKGSPAAVVGLIGAGSLRDTGRREVALIRKTESLNKSGEARSVREG